MTLSQAKEKLLQFLSKRGKAHHSTLIAVLDNDKNLYEELKEILLFEDYVNEVEGKGLVIIEKNLDFSEDEKDHEINLNTKPKKPLKLFISYGHDENKILVDKIVEDLKSRGHKAWIDHNQEKHQGIRPGDNWRREITKGILDSDGVLSFLSKHSTREPGVCLDEIGIAVGVKSAHIQTILVEDENVAKAPPIISHVQWHDMRHWKEFYDKGGNDWDKWYQEHLKEIVRVVESDQTIRFAGEIAELEEQLHPILFDARLEQLLRNPFVGREWLTDAMENWRVDDPESRVFWLVGGPGIGKSAFATNYAHFGKDKVIGLFLCQWNMPGMKNPTKIIKTLAFQLATRLPDFRLFLIDIIKNKALSELSDFELFNALIADPLSRAIKGGRERLIIVIDALDEATSGDDNILAQVIGQHGGRLPQEVGILVTSRPESNVIRHLQGLNPYKLDANRPENKRDITLYIQSRLSEQLSARKNPDELLNIIVDKSENNFLYVERFCDDVLNGNISLDDPDSFPLGLSGLLFEYCQRQFPDLEKYKSHYRDPIRCILASDKAPLPVVVLKSIFNWNEEELRELIREIGSLFVTPIVDGIEVIQPYHKSLIDLLTNPDFSHDYFVALKQGYQLLAEYQWGIYRSGDYMDDRYLLKTFPHHLIHAHQWDPLEKVLTDLMFMDAKVSARLVFELYEDYIETLQYLPENQENIRKEKERQDRLNTYAEDLVKYAKGEILDLDIPESISPLPDEEIQKEIDRIIENPTRLDKIQAFRQFVTTNLFALEAGASFPYNTIQRAYNYSSNFTIRNEAIKKLVKIKALGIKQLFLLKSENWLFSLSAKPAIISRLKGHEGAIRSVCISPNGKIVYSASADRTIRVWNIKSSKCIKILKGHTNVVNSICMTPDNKLGASAGYYLRVWDLISGKCTMNLEDQLKYGQPIYTIQVTSDGKLAVSGHTDGTIRVWDIPDRKCIKILKGHTNSIRDVSISPDGKLAISADRNSILEGNGTIRVWDIPSGKCIHTHKNNGESISSVKLTPDGKIGIIASDRTLKKLNTKLSKSIFSIHSQFNNHVQITPDGKMAVSAHGRSLRVWNLNSGECIKNFEGHSDQIYDICITPDGMKVISGSKDHSLIIWDIFSSLSTKPHGENPQPINLIKTIPNKCNFFLTVTHNNIQIWDIESAKCLRKLSIDNRKKLEILSDGKTAFIAVGYSIAKWDLFTGQRLGHFMGHSDYVNGIKISPNETSIISVSCDNTIKIWDLMSGECLNTLAGHTNSVLDLIITSDNKVVVSWCDKTIRIWDLSSGKCLNILKGDFMNRKTKISPDNKLIISLLGSAIQVWEIKTGMPIMKIKNKTSRCFTFSSSRSIIFEGENNTIIECDIYTGDYLKTFEGNSDRVVGLSITNDNQLLVSTSLDKTLRIWNISKGTCIQAFLLDSVAYSVALKDNLVIYGTETGEVGVLEIKCI